jgi:phenylalanyl-tRNA synthetase alpha subunit
MRTTANTANITHLQTLLCEDQDTPTRLHVGPSRQLAPERAYRVALVDADGYPMFAPWDGDTPLIAYGATVAQALNVLNHLCRTTA